MKQNEVWLINLDPTIGTIEESIMDEIRIGLAKVLSIDNE